MYSEVERIVADHFGVSIDEIRAGGRGMCRNVTDARHFTWYILHSVLGYRGGNIAVRYNTSKRNVFLSVAMVRDGMKTQPFFSRNYRIIQEKLKDSELL